MFALLLSLALATPRFNNVDDAAKWGMKEAVVCSHNEYECGGVVYESKDHKYYSSNIITSHLHYGLDMQIYNTGLPDDALRIVADFHTHICSPHNKVFANYFSGADAIVNQVFKSVGYMYSFCDGNIHRYDPSQDDADDEEVDLHSGKVFYLTIGHIVGWIPFK